MEGELFSLFLQTPYSDAEKLAEIKMQYENVAVFAKKIIKKIEDISYYESLIKEGEPSVI